MQNSEDKVCSEENLQELNASEAKKKVKDENVDNLANKEAELIDEMDQLANKEAGDDQLFEEKNEQIQQLQHERDEFKDKYLRVSAEIENVRKRSKQEIDNTRKYGINGFATELLSVRDSLELAANVDLNDVDLEVVKKMKEGLELTVKQLDQAFSKFKISEISPNPGDALDPKLHQAMSLQPTDEFQPNTIVNVFQKGYMISDRLLRPAMVVVAKKTS